MDKILYQGEGYTIALSENPMTAVPYPPADHEDGNYNSGFCDLRDRPDLVEKIPEASKSPGFQNLLCTINRMGSPLMSIGCECGYFANETASEGHPTGYIGSYVGITFRDAKLSADQNLFVGLAKSILRGVKPSGSHHICFEMIIEPLKHFFGSPGCFELTVRCFGHGFSEEEAWDAFNAATQAVAESIEQVIDRPNCGLLLQ